MNSPLSCREVYMGAVRDVCEVDLVIRSVIVCVCRLEIWCTLVIRSVIVLCVGRHVSGIL